jgi:hypothetical protein
MMRLGPVITTEPHIRGWFRVRWLMSAQYADRVG